MARILIFLGTYGDTEHMDRLKFLTVGSQVIWKIPQKWGGTIAELDFLAEGLAKQGSEVLGIVTTDADLVFKLRARQLDSIPDLDTKISLTKWAGSLLHTPGNTPVLVMEPLLNLVTREGWYREACKRWLKKLTAPHSFLATPEFVWRSLNLGNYESVLERAQSAILASVDIETIIDDPLRRVSIIGFTFLWPSGTCETYTIDCFDSGDWGDDLATPLLIASKFLSLSVPKIMQGGLYDASYFIRWGIPLTNWIWDTAVLMHCMFSEYPKRLDFITAWALLDVRYWKDESGREPLRYNAKDCFNTLWTFLALMREAEPYALTNYLKEFKLLMPCLHMGMTGIDVDQERFDKHRAKIEEEDTRRTKELQQLLGVPSFNPGSPPQTVRLLAALGLSRFKDSEEKTIMKAQATSKFNATLLEKILEIRGLRKLLTTQFVPEKIWLGKIFYRLDPSATDTGRLNSSESSFWCGYQIQNVSPTHEVQNYIGMSEVKDYLRTPEGWLFAEIDKEQSEARCVGYLTGEKALIDLVEGPHDYHAWNASKFFGIPYVKIFDEEFFDTKTGKKIRKTLDKVIRDLSKRTNHGANYNMGASTLLDTMGPLKVFEAKKTLKLPIDWSLLKVCEFLLSQYDKTYPKVRGAFQTWIVKTVAKTGQLVSQLGWTRVFFNRDLTKVKHYLNSAVAHLPQNLSVGIVNEELFDIWVAMMGPLRGRIRIIAQIHDSILFCYRKDDDEVVAIVESMMRTKVKVMDIDGVEREFCIPNGVSSGATHWSGLKS